MTPLKDSTKTTIADHAIDLQVNQQNVKTLTPEDAKAHLALLSNMLRMTAQVMLRKLGKEGGNNPDFLNYLHKLTSTLDAIIMKHQLAAMQPNSDIQLSCTIDPSDSGFPIFIRDFKFLRSDKANAAEQLANLPEDDKLVDDALYLLFRGLFPKDVILQKLTRKYYETLVKTTLPEALFLYPDAHIKEENEMNYCKLSFERLDENNNLPRFYTLYLKIPSKTYDRRPGWREDVEQAIREGLSTVAKLELTYLAQKVEAVEGVQLEYVERFDIGPFYDIYTENGEMVRALVESAQDCIMMFSKAMAVRTGESERLGLGERMKGWMSGDTVVGMFSPIIESPQYILMSHRLIQKVHNLNITLKEHTKMFGVTSTGEIYE